MIPAIEKMKEELYTEYGIVGVKEMHSWCATFMVAYNYAKETEKKCELDEEKI